MKKAKFWKNNKGASLILVIGCIALLSVVGAMLLKKTANNREMKEQERKAQQAFYESESGSQMMVTALEQCAQDALKSAYVDMLLQYSVSTNPQQRFEEYFVKALQAELNSETAEAALKEKLGITNTEFENLDLSVSYKADADAAVLDGVATTDASGKITDSRNVLLEGVTFSYTNPSTGAQTKLTTNIKIQTKVPDLAAGMNYSGNCDFSDFTLITSGDVNAGSSGSINGAAALTGNVYVGGKMNITSNNTSVKITNAEKALIKGIVEITNKGLFQVNNSSILSGGDSSGKGVWADGLSVVDGGKIDATSNFYIADDLNISGTGSSVVMKGNGEYVGYSSTPAVPGDASSGNSAITINTSADITLDFSEMDQLILKGSSYIFDQEKWSEKIGILQGESIAYKDLQAMYLFPADCLTAVKHNPMLSAEASDLSYTLTWTIDGEDINLGDYVVATQPYVKRTVQLEGGETVFTYLYMNFKNEASAMAYVNKYLSTSAGERIKKQIKNLGNSEIALAAHNHAISNMLTYTINDAGTPEYTFMPGEGNTSTIALKCLAAKQYRTGLFSNLFRGASNVVVDDLVEDSILAADAFKEGGPTVPNDGQIHEVATATVGAIGGIGGREVKLYVVNAGGAEFQLTSSMASAINPLNGILLVNGNLKYSTGTGLEVNGLVLATGDVEFTTSADLKANKENVEALLSVPEAAEYFRGLGNGGSGSFLSSEAVSINFENWLKN